MTDAFLISSSQAWLLLAASAALAAAPGPDNIFVLTQSALHGRRAGLAVMVGLFSGIVVHTVAVALGVAAIFATSAIAFTVLKAVGAAYLLFLAWQAWRATPTALAATPSPALTGAQLFRRGVVMNLTNPKIAIFMLAFLPQFADPARGNVSGQILLFGLLFIVAALPVFVACAMGGALLGRWLGGSPKRQLWLNRLSATVFVGMAAKLATASH